MGRKSKDYYSSEDRDLHNTIRELKSKIRRLESDKRKLISEIQGYKKAFNLTIAEIDKRLIDLPVEDVIRIVNSKHKKSVKYEKKQKVAQKANNKLKWTCHSCNEGHMVIIKYMKASGIEWYHRACSSPKCKNRTTAKKWHDKVEGLEPEEG